MVMVRAGGLAAAAALAAALAGAPAQAQDGEAKWFVRGGGVALSLRDKLDLTFAGQPVPGAGMNTETHVTPMIQIGRRLGDRFAIAFTGGIPPEIEIEGRGALAPFGRLAETTYGPMTLTGQFRPVRSGPVQPYVGAGVVYMLIFDTNDGAFSDVEIDDDLGPALEAGTDIMLNDRFGLFVEVKKGWLRTESRGTFNGLPVVGQVKLDPWAFSGGVTVRF
jgi:outer membrane protein W